MKSSAAVSYTHLNLTPKDKESIEWRKSVYQSVQDTLENTTEDQLADGAEYWAIDLEGKEDVRRNTVGLSTVFTYIGLYLGTVFLIACSVMLALQQLSSASSDQQRYRTLVPVSYTHLDVYKRQDRIQCIRFHRYLMKGAVLLRLLL